MNRPLQNRNRQIQRHNGGVQTILNQRRRAAANRRAAASRLSKFSPQSKPTITKQTPSARINKVKAIPYQSGDQGMTIGLDINVDNLQNVECFAAAYFYDSNGNPLGGDDRNYHTSDNQVCTVTYFTPSYVSSNYENLELYLPYNALCLPYGHYRLKVDIVLRISSSGDYLFRDKTKTFQVAVQADGSKSF